jgi:hypothetical protein
MISITITNSPLSCENLVQIDENIGQFTQLTKIFNQKKKKVEGNESEQQV